jgi:AraC-like DNA-binding protein
MTAAGPVTFNNTYRGAPRGARYEHWREEICRGLCNIDIGPGDNADVIDMHCRLANLAPVGIAIGTGSSARIGRSHQTTGDGGDAFTFVCDTQSPLPFHHHGKIDAIGKSDVILGDLTQASGATLGDCQKFTALVIDRKTLLNAAPMVENIMFKPLRIADGLGDMIGRYAAMAADAAPFVDAHGRFLMGQHLVDLISLALGTRPDDAELARQRGQAQARLALMKSDICANLSVEDLGIDVIARRYGLSTRQAQRAFEHGGITFTDFLLEQRLLLAHKLLLNPANRWRKIGDIAHSAGFAELSYFNRVFRRRFGITPSEVRSQND